jgi:hypothetical protein
MIIYVQKLFTDGCTTQNHSSEPHKRKERKKHKMKIL